MENLQGMIASLADLIENAQANTLHLFDFNDLSHQQVNYLQTIIKLKNPTISELASELRLTKPTVTVLVDKLVSKGYITKVQSDTDRRCTHLHIAEKGLKINEAHEAAHELLAQQFSSKLTETETKILVELLKKLVRNN